MESLRSSSSSQKSPKASGVCSVCGNVRKLHDKNGKVHLHGPRIKPCLGSNELPAAYGSQLDPSSQRGPSWNQGIVLPDSVASGQDIGSLTRNCLHPVPKGRILKHIPKAARPSVSRLLATIINRILADPTSVHQWQCLLSFAAVVLEQPVRGGRRHNLTATIKKRADSFSTTGQTRVPWFSINSYTPIGLQFAVVTRGKQRGQQLFLRSWRKVTSQLLFVSYVQTTNRPLLTQRRWQNWR